jgi:putative DNA primase/helicase
MILGRDGDWNFRKIVGVISTQTMRPDGTLLVEPGYDADTKLLLIAPPTLPDDMPQTPDARRRHEGIGVA